MENKTRSLPGDAQSLDTVFELLSDSRRRYAVSFLAERGSNVSLTDLATEVASWEHQTESTEVPAERVDEIAVTLHHNHLPKLADANLLAYDTETKRVNPTRVGELHSFVVRSGTDGE